MKAIIKAIIAGSVIIGVGLIILIVALGLNGWKFMPDFSTEQFTAEGEIAELRLEDSGGKIRTEFYDGESIAVDYPVSEQYVMEVKEQDGVLTVSGLKRKHWYNFIFIPNALPETVVKIPRGTVLKMSVTVNAGSVSLAAGEYAETNVTVNAGNLNIADVTCPKFVCKINAGAISAESLDCDSFECDINAGAFSADRLRCPQIRAEVSAGSVSLAVAGNMEEYSVIIDKTAGSCNLSGQIGTDPSKRMDIKVSAGSVNVSFL